MINAGSFHLFRMGFVYCDKLITFGQENQTWKLKCYNPRNGEKLASQELGCEPMGLAVVELGGKRSVALSD